MPKPALPLSSPKVQETVPALIFYSYFDSHINSPHRNLSPFAQLLLFFPHINPNARRKARFGLLWSSQQKGKLCVWNFMTQSDVRLQSHISSLNAQVTWKEFYVPTNVNFLLFTDHLSYQILDTSSK